MLCPFGVDIFPAILESWRICHNLLFDVIINWCKYCSIKYKTSRGNSSVVNFPEAQKVQAVCAVSLYVPTAVAYMDTNEQCSGNSSC